MDAGDRAGLEVLSAPAVPPGSGEGLLSIVSHIGNQLENVPDKLSDSAPQGVVPPCMWSMCGHGLFKVLLGIRLSHVRCFPVLMALF